ncbi:MAG: hypothetical protein ETSY1_08495 [Candidatus Entotheonella factor]|uniref:DUF58 domain-containing protein n=1 Tax=Entotheonella factor TaxID=1429438 RepID=W4LTF8_ENTF1|nr:DUF58 domain-containing protein [Candidatus Entotheonella palauensis]ETX01155.1 MAG: hypothetical protein ETSY1_08495 [Candidatus Entotheonella factor]
MYNFVVFVAVLFVLAAVLQVNFFFTIAYFFAGIYIVSRIWSKRVVKQLSMRRDLTQRAFLGDEIDVTLTLENRGWLPIPWLMIHDPYPLDLAATPLFKQVIRMQGHAVQRFHYRLRARRRGYYEIGPLRADAGDLLGLHHWQRDAVPAEYVIVYPKMQPIAKLPLPTHSPQVVLPTALPIFEDPARLMGVRDYAWGDNPRYIHWTATAATGQTLVKQFEPAIARETALFLNMARDDYDRSEQRTGIELAITVAASLARHMVMVEKLPVGLHTMALDPLTNAVQQFSLPPHKEQGQLLRILDVLARIESVEADQAVMTFSEWVQQQSVHLSWGATLMILTNQLSEPLLQVLQGARQGGLKPALVLVRGNRAHPAIRQLNFPVFDIWEEQDIERWPRVA